MDNLRTHTLGALRLSDEGKEVLLQGWVHRRRDHGGLIFIDLRDRFGLTQIVFDPKENEGAHDLAQALRSEWVIEIRGNVRHRGEGLENPKLPTGQIEVLVDHLTVLSKAKTPPFSVSDEHIDVHEEKRLVHRYLDIRRGEVLKNLIIRHKTMQIIRNFMNEENFIDVTTPILGKSTPEGARDYLVPSRVHPSHFYALPQSPQLYKQLLMVSGLDRYYQIAQCFRDEDLRSDRQPEFTQLDLEMSFGTPDQLMGLMEKLFRTLFREILNVEAPQSFRRMTFKECFDRYGTDRPDLRFGMELINVSDIAEKSEFGVFLEQVKNGGVVKGIKVPEGENLSRKDIDNYTKFVGYLGIRGLAWMKMTNEGLSSNIVKFFGDQEQKQLIERFDLKPGDLIFMISDEEKRANIGLDHLRRKVAADRGLIDENAFEFLWVTDFPMFEYSEEKNKFLAVHHPFTYPLPEDLHLMKEKPEQVRSIAYDLVLNGYELGGGSRRIHDEEVQQQVFDVLELSKEEVKEQFGFFVEALRYGTPPHLGIAFGLDRVTMLLSKTDNIRDVIAFPKTQKATDLMTQAPSHVTKEQLDELHISTHDSQSDMVPA